MEVRLAGRSVGHVQVHLIAKDVKQTHIPLCLAPTVGKRGLWSLWRSFCLSSLKLWLSPKHAMPLVVPQSQSDSWTNGTTCHPPLSPVRHHSSGSFSPNFFEHCMPPNFFEHCRQEKLCCAASRAFFFFAVVVKEYNSSFLTKGEEYSVLSVSVARLYHPHSILPYPLIFSPFSVLFFFCMLCCIHLSICYWQDSEYRIFFVFGDGYMRKNTLSSDSIDSDVILHSFNSKWLS